MPARQRAQDERQQHEHDHRVEAGSEHRDRRDRERRDAEEDQAEINQGDRGLRHVEQEAGASPYAAGDRRGENVKMSPPWRFRGARVGGQVPSIAVDAEGLMNGQHAAPGEQDGVRHGVPHHRDQEHPGDDGTAGRRRRVQIHHAYLLRANALGEVRIRRIGVHRRGARRCAFHAGRRISEDDRFGRAADPTGRRTPRFEHDPGASPFGQQHAGFVGHAPRFEKLAALRFGLEIVRGQRNRLRRRHLRAGDVGPARGVVRRSPATSPCRRCRSAREASIPLPGKPARPWRASRAAASPKRSRAWPRDRQRRTLQPRLCGAVRPACTPPGPAAGRWA